MACVYLNCFICRWSRSPRLSNDHSPFCTTRRHIRTMKKIKPLRIEETIDTEVLVYVLYTLCTQIMRFNSWQRTYLKTHLNANRFSFASYNKRTIWVLFFYIVHFSVIVILFIGFSQLFSVMYAVRCGIVFSVCFSSYTL